MECTWISSYIVACFKEFVRVHKQTESSYGHFRQGMDRVVRHVRV
jgi:hypothetical protein